MQDEIGVQATDYIAVVALLIVRLVQDQISSEVIENKEEADTLIEYSVQDQIRPVPG